MFRRAVVALGVSLLGFVIAVVEDPVMVDAIGWPETFFRFVLYAFLCCTAFVVVRIEDRHARSVAGLSVLREELLAQTMTASEDLQRRISESIHDGPLQDVLVVRQLVELDAAFPGDERIGRALAGLQGASDRLRQATFELHPSVLEQVGLGAAVEQLAAFTAQRSGIEVSTEIDYPIRNSIDPIVFGVVRELLSNVVHHSRPGMRRSRSGSPIKDAFCTWSTTVSESATGPWRAGSVRDTSVWRRIAPGWTPPAGCLSSSTRRSARTSAWSCP